MSDAFIRISTPEASIELSGPVEFVIDRLDNAGALIDVLKTLERASTQTADAKEIEDKINEVLKEIYKKQMDISEQSAQEAKEQYKKALKIILESQELQTQAIQKLIL